MLQYYSINLGGWILITKKLDSTNSISDIVEVELTYDGLWCSQHDYMIISKTKT